MCPFLTLPLPSPLHVSNLEEPNQIDSSKHSERKSKCKLLTLAWWFHNSQLATMSSLTGRRDIWTAVRPALVLIWRQVHWRARESLGDANSRLKSWGREVISASWSCWWCDMWWAPLSTQIEVHWRPGDTKKRLEVKLWMTFPGPIANQSDIARQEVSLVTKKPDVKIY